MFAAVSHGVEETELLTSLQYRALLMHTHQARHACELKARALACALGLRGEFYKASPGALEVPWAATRVAPTALRLATATVWPGR